MKKCRFFCGKSGILLRYFTVFSKSVLKQKRFTNFLEKLLKSSKKSPIWFPIRSLLLKLFVSKLFSSFIPQIDLFCQKVHFLRFFLKQCCLNTLFYTFFYIFMIFFTTIIKGISSKFNIFEKKWKSSKFSKSRKIQNPLVEKTIIYILNLVCKYRILIIFLLNFSKSHCWEALNTQKSEKVKSPLLDRLAK